MHWRSVFVASGADISSKFHYKHNSLSARFDYGYKNAKVRHGHRI